MNLLVTLGHIFTTKPTPQMLKECEDIYVFTPSKWNPHNTAYAHHEEHMLDWQGNMVDPRDHQTINLIDIKEDADIASATYVGSVEEQAIITLLDKPSHVFNDKDLTSHVVPEDVSEVGSVLHTINPLLND